MPSETPKQARFMAWMAHDPAAAAAHGVKLSVAKEFNQADKGTGILRKKSKKTGNRLLDLASQ